jgi:hypothetical protein
MTLGPASDMFSTVVYSPVSLSQLEANIQKINLTGLFV